jgi:hypothetical protein
MLKNAARLLAVVAMLVAVPASANYMANATARFINYADGSAGNDSTGNGGSDAPYQTLAHALAVTPSAGEVRLVGSAGAPVTYTATMSFAKTITISAVETGGAIIAGSGTTAAISLTAAAANVTLSGVIVDPSLNSGGAAEKCVDFASAATPITFAATNVTFRNWTGNCLGTETNGRANITLTNVTASGGAVDGFLYFNNFFSGTITISGGSCTLTAVKATFGADGCVTVFGGIGGSAGTKTVSISNFNTTLTVNPSGGGTQPGLRHQPLPSEVPGVSGGTHVCTAVGAGQYCHGIAIGTSGQRRRHREDDLADDVRGRGHFQHDQLGVRLGIGQDGATSADWAYVVAPVIENSTADTNSTGASTGTHMAFIGGGDGGLISNVQIGTITGYCGIGVVDKETRATAVTAATATGCSSSDYLSKGTTNSVYSAGIIKGKSGGAGNGLVIEDNNGTGTHSTGLSVSGMTFDANGQTGFRYVDTQSASNTATFASNTYNKSSGTLTAHPWVYPNGVNIDNQAGWLAVEPTATFGAGVP